MQISESLFGSQLENIQRALGKTSQRQSLLMANLANVNTPGYKRKDIDFNIVLDEAVHGPSMLQRLKDSSQETSPSNTEMRKDGNNVDLEREVFSISETEARYQVLTEMTNNYFANMKSVIREGK